MTSHQMVVWHAFWEINRARYTDNGYRPLNDGDIARWCRRKGYSRRFEDVLWWHIVRLDDEYLRLMGEKREREQRQREQLDGLMKAI